VTFLILSKIIIMEIKDINQTLALATSVLYAMLTTI